MTPVAAYYIYIANEHERATANDSPRPRPSLLDRVRALVSALRPKPAAARPA